MGSRVAMPSLALIAYSLLIPVSLVYERGPAVVVPIALSETDSVSKIDSIAHAPLTSRTSGILLHDRATQTSEARLVANYGKLPLSFEVNEGQTHAKVRFVSRGRGYSLFLTDTEAVIALKKSSPLMPDAWELHGLPDANPRLGKSAQQTENKIVRMQLAGANPSPRAVAKDELPGKVNYFIGNDPAKWRTNVPTYAKVKYEGVYPGVDLVYYGNQGQLEYDFVVAPGVDTDLIRLNLHGAGHLHIDEHGDLLLGEEQDQMRFLKPLVYQEIAGQQTPVDSSYALTSNREVTFQIGGYDHAHPLVIDPVLVYSTFLGSPPGNSTTQGNGIAVDASGNAYITGSTTLPTFPVVNPLQATIGDTFVGDAFVSKLSPSGSLLYSTFLGGNDKDLGQGIAVDASGNAYVTGQTYSQNFPTANALQPVLGHPGASNAFVTKIGPTGSTLVYSTYLGGSGSGAGGDQGYGIAADTSGNAYVTGFTNSLNFPLANALQATYSGTFVSKINPSGSAFLYSTYLGGGYSDQARAIAVDTSGNAYVTGITGSGNFPTVNAQQPQFGGANDAFVAKLNSTGSALVYSTYLGGSASESGQGIAVDASDSAYVTGYTYSLNFPAMQALQPTIGDTFSGSGDAFVSKFNPSGLLVYSTYLGGSRGDDGTSIAVDASGNAYVTGGTGSPDFPTANALQTTVSNVFVSELNSTGSRLVYSTYLGVTGDAAQGIGVDASGNAYLTGVNLSSGAVAFVKKISPGIPTTTALASSLNPANLGQSVTCTATVTTQGTGTPTGTISFSDGNLVLAQVPLGANGQATFTSSSLMPLGHSISAQYDGDGTFASSIATLTQTIIGPILNGVPPALAFGQQLFETSSAPQSFTLSNTGNADLHVSSVSILGLNPGSNPADFAQTNTCASAPVAPTASCQINVTFTPVTGGPLSATLSINDDLPSSPQLVALSGYGLAPLVGFPSGSSVGFGNQQIGTTSSAHTVTLENIGSAPLFISGVTVTGLNVGDFSNANFCPVAPVSLAPGATCSLNVTFTPTAQGTRYASLTFTDGPPAGSQQSVGLVGTGTGGSTPISPTVPFLGGGSSSLFAQLGQAAINLNGGAGGGCVWTQGTTPNIVARDDRTIPATDEQGNIWIVWSPGTGSCSAPAGNFAVYSYMSVDTAANRCFFEVDASGTPGCVQMITVAPNTSGANLLCYPSPSSCSYFGDTAGGIPAPVINAIANQHWFAAGTDILPADAKFATYRMLTPCGQAIWRQPFDQVMRETYGLGYQTSTPGVGTPVQSYYSSASAGLLDFNIMGNDPLTGLPVPAYGAATVGAQPILVAVSPAGGNGIGAARDIPSFVLMNFYDGTLGRATDLLGPSAPSGVTTLVREPQSGDYNVFEWSAVNNSQFHDSQDAFNCSTTTGAIISNPMNLLSMNGNAASPGGQNSYRRRVIGTGEMTAQLQAATSTDNRLGYFYWSAANAAAFNASNGKYLTVDGVDPLQDSYTDGVLPGVDASHPLSNVTFKSLNQGDYPIWSTLRLISQSPTPVGVTNLIEAAQALASIQYDFIPVSSLTVWHSHYYLPALGLNTAANGNTLNPATPNDLCPGYLPEFGGDAGGANILKHAEYDFCVDFGNIMGLINKTK